MIFNRIPLFSPLDKKRKATYHRIMKKIVACFCLCVVLFPLAAVETWLSVKYQYGFSFQTEKNKLSDFFEGKDKYWRIGQQNINFKTDIFWNKNNVGLFLECGIPFLLPEFTGGSSKDGPFEDHFSAVSIPLSFGCGATFRHSISEKGTIHYAFGMGLTYTPTFIKSRSRSMAGTPLKEEKGYMHTLVFSFLGDIGYKNNFASNVFFDCGLSYAFEFAKHDKDTYNTNRGFSKTGKTEKWAEKFFGVKISPYIGIGFVF